MFLSDFNFFIFHDANYIGSSPVVLRTSCETLRLQDKPIAGLSSFTVSTVAAISLSSAFLDTWQGGRFRSFMFEVISITKCGFKTSIKEVCITS